MRRYRITLMSSMLLYALLAPASPAVAQASEKTADDHFNEGRKLAGQGYFEEAYSAYIAAWRLKQSYDIAANLASVELRLRRFRDAAEHSSYFVRIYPSKKGDEKLKHVRDILDMARKEVGAARIHLAADDGRIVEGAKVLVSGASIGSWSPTMDEVFVHPGRRSFVARLQGCEDAAMQVDVQKDRTHDVPLTLKCRTDPPWWLAGAGAGLAVVGLGVGIGSGIYSGDRSDAANESWAQLYKRGGEGACFGGANQASCDALVQADKDARTFKNIAVAGFVVGGVAAVGSVLTAALILGTSPSKGSQGRRPVEASVGFVPSGGAAVVWGSF